MTWWFSFVSCFVFTSCESHIETRKETLQEACRAKYTSCDHLPGGALMESMDAGDDCVKFARKLICRKRPHHRPRVSLACLHLDFKVISAAPGAAYQDRRECRRHGYPGRGPILRGNNTGGKYTRRHEPNTEKEMHQDRQVSRFTAIGALFLALSCTSVQEPVARPLDLTRTSEDL
jgi:hypothetical protein